MHAHTHTFCIFIDKLPTEFNKACGN